MRIFRNPPNLQNAVIDLGLENDESYVNNLLKQCMRRFMNLNKLERVIFNSLTKHSVSHQTQILIKLISYIYTQPKGKEISTDMFVASVRALEKVDPSESLILGETLVEQIPSIPVYRRMIGIYITLNQLDRAEKLIENLSNSEWSVKAKKRIESLQKLNAGIIDGESNGSKFFNIIKPVEKPPFFENVTMACLFDRFTFDCLSRDVNLIPISKTNWKSVLNRPDVNYFFAESIWSGHDGGWRFAMSSFDTTAGNQLREVLDYCKSNDITTIFWNKEDPVNYASFIDVAKHFDYIFTSDENIIDRYVEHTGNSNVFALPFAAQPIIHNPIRNSLPDHDVCFAGSWYVRDHGNRKKDTKLLVDAASEFDLHIYDRFFGTDNRNKFPAEYDDFIKGSLSYNEVCMAYRAYKIFLNVNSVADSPTMFSRRVFEILASSTALVSTGSIGMEKMLGSNIHVVNNEQKAKDTIDNLLSNQMERKKIAHLGYREVMNKHTYKIRLEYIFKKLNIAFERKNIPLISCITCSNRPKMIDNIIRNFTQQNYQNKELILLLEATDDEFKQIQNQLSEITNVKLVRQLNHEKLGSVFNKGVGLSNGEYIAKFDDDDYYGPNYLSDGILPFDYTIASVVGKTETFLYHENSEKFYLRFSGKSHKYLDFVMGATIIAKREVFDYVKFGETNTGEDSEFLRRCNQHGFKIYSSDPFNWVHVRKKSSNFHTWQVDDEDLLRPATELNDVEIDRDIFL